jgi:hypothetical protein
MENVFESIDKKLKKLREVDLNNTTDEQVLAKLLEKTPALLVKLKNISQPNELDGFFKIFIEKTGIEKANKQTIITALRKALEDLAPDDPNFTSPTKKANNTKQSTPSPTKINESFKRMQKLAGTINEALKPSAYKGGWYSPSVNKPKETEKPSYSASVVSYYKTNFKQGGEEGIKKEIPDISVNYHEMQEDQSMWFLVLSSNTVDLNTPESFAIIKKYVNIPS